MATSRGRTRSTWPYRRSPGTSPSAGSRTASPPLSPAPQDSGAPSRGPCRLAAGEPPAQDLVDLLRVGLAAGGLHALADQRIEGLLLAGAELGDRPRMGGQHLVDQLLDRSGIRDLLQSPRLDDRVGRIAFAVPQRGEDFLGRLVVDGAVEHAA